MQQAPSELSGLIAHQLRTCCSWVAQLGRAAVPGSGAEEGAGRPSSPCRCCRCATPLLALLLLLCHAAAADTLALLLSPPLLARRPRRPSLAGGGDRAGGGAVPRQQPLPHCPSGGGSLCRPGQLCLLLLLLLGC